MNASISVVTWSLLILKRFITSTKTNAYEYYSIPLMLVLVASYCLLYQDCCRGSNRRILLVLCAILHS